MSVGSTAHIPDLKSALEESLAVHFGRTRKVRRLERRPAPYRSSFPLEDVDVELADGTVLPLVLKELNAEALSEEARKAKPAFLIDPKREIIAYNDVLESETWGTATCYGTFIDGPRHFLWLEKVAGVPLWQLGKLDIWCQVARWSAQVHGHFTGDDAAAVQLLPLLRFNDVFFRTWWRRLKMFAETGKVSIGVQRLMKRLRGRYDDVIGVLAELPTTFVHGEFYASNILIEPSATGIRICPVDWELAGTGSGLLDLAALTSGKWTEEQRNEIVAAYEAALPKSHPWRRSPDGFRKALDYCRLHLAVQWLAWSPGWSPPAEHAQDWLGEASRLANQLGF
jgi:hypothetical protein